MVPWPEVIVQYNYKGGCFLVLILKWATCVLAFVAFMIIKPFGEQLDYSRELIIPMTFTDPCTVSVMKGREVVDHLIAS